MLEKKTEELDWTQMPVAGFEGKSLLELKNGGFKMVRIQPGSAFPLHHHPEKTEFAYVLAGVLEATIGEEVYVGGAGRFYQFPVGVTHGLKNPGSEETVVLIGAIAE